MAWYLVKPRDKFHTGA